MVQNAAAMSRIDHNPVTASHTNLQWAQLTRLAGDRAAILFEDLRRRVGTIAGLVEELHYDGVTQRWTPCYHLDDEVLFTAHILPAALEATLTLDADQRHSLLGSRRLSSTMKHLIQQTPIVQGQVSVRARLNSQAAVRAFATLILMKSKLVSTALKGRRSGVSTFRSEREKSLENSPRPLAGEGGPRRVGVGEGFADFT